MTNLSAVIAIEQLKKLKTFNSIRIKIIKKYIEGTKNLTNLKLPFEFKLKDLAIGFSF